MQSLFQKTGLTFLIVGMSGWVNVVPAIAQLTNSDSDTASDVVSEAITEPYSLEDSSETVELVSEELTEDAFEATAETTDVEATEDVSESGTSDTLVEALEPEVETSSDTPMEGAELEETPAIDELDANGFDEGPLDEGALDEDASAEDTTAEDPIAEESTIVEVAASSETFTTLVSALSETELAEVLQGDGPFTVFAPTDQAFESLPEGTVEALLAPENKEILVSLLSYHVVADELMVEDLETGFVDSVQGTPLNVEVGDSVTVNGVSVIDNNISASNGVIHVVDQVILPPQ